MCTRGVCVCVGIQGCVIQVDVTLGKCLMLRYGLWLLSVLLWDTDGCKFGWEFGQVSYVEGYIIGWGYKQMCYSMDGGLLWFCGIQMCALG